MIGAAGAIGWHVVDACLSRGIRVRALVRDAARAPVIGGLPVESVTGDLAEPESIDRAIEGCDLVFHCAAPYPRSHFGRARQVARSLALTESFLSVARRHVAPELLESPRGRLRIREIEQAEGAALALRYQPERESELRGQVRSSEDLEAALAGRLNASLHPSLAECAGMSGVKRIVYVSSVTTIGRPRGAQSKGARPLAREDDRHDRIRATSPYFSMKQEMESAVTRAAVEGMPIVITNPTFCIDAHDKGPTSGQLILAVARRGMPFYLPGSLNAVATRDVGEGIVLAAEKGRTGMRYILGGENMSARTFLERTASIAGVAPPRAPIPLPLAEGIAYFTEVTNLLFRRPWPLLPLGGVQMMKHSQPVDTTLARTELGMPLTPIDTAIADALRWFRENGYFSSRG